MSDIRTLAPTIPETTLEWCAHCGNESVIDSFLVSRCSCGKPLLPCSTCTECRINDKYDACARYGISLKDEDEELERLIDPTYLRTKCQQIEINFLLDPEVYLDAFITSMLVDLRLRGVPFDSISLFADANRCALNATSSLIRRTMDKIQAEFPALEFKQLVCLAYWECFCAQTNRSILRILQNKDEL